MGQADAAHALRQLRGLLVEWKVVVVERSGSGGSRRPEVPRDQGLEEFRDSRVASWQDGGGEGEGGGVEANAAVDMLR